MHHQAGKLGPIRADLELARRSLVEELRRLFSQLDISVRAYAHRQGIDPSLVTRYLKGDVMPPEEFGLDLADEVRRKDTRGEEIDDERLRSLYRAAQDASPRGWGNATRLRRAVTEALNKANVAQGDLRVLIERYAVAQQRIAELELRSKILQGQPQAMRKETKRPRWEVFRDTLERNRLAPDDLHSLDDATDRIVDRLTDPASRFSPPVDGRVFVPEDIDKPLYVGALVSKSIDAGSRLVLVLTPPLNKVRNQFQAQLIEGLQPSPSRGVPPLILTGQESDYRSTAIAVLAMQFEKRSPELPLYDPRNLDNALTRLLVVKRNTSIIRKLTNDIQKIHTPLNEIPALIVDADGTPLMKGGALEKLMANLKGILPRAQLVTFSTLSVTEGRMPNDFMMWLPGPVDRHADGD